MITALSAALVTSTLSCLLPQTRPWSSLATLPASSPPVHYPTLCQHTEPRITALKKFLLGSPRPPPHITAASSEPPTLAEAALVTEGEAAADRSEVLDAFCLMNHEGSGGPRAVATCVVVATGLARPGVTTTTTASCLTLPPLPSTPPRIARGQRRRVGRSSRWTE